MSVRSWPTRPLGELLRHVQDPVSVQPNQRYPNFGIYSFGRGVFEKPPIDGSTSSAKALYRARAGQFVYSRLFAFEGAYGVVPDELDGCFVSNEFPLFEAQSDELRLPYLEWYFRLPATWTAVSAKATGMGNRRQRIHPDGILAHEIPLPEPPEQDRIVAKLGAAAARVAKAQLHCCEINEQRHAFVTSLHLALSEDRVVQVESLLQLDEDVVSVEPDGAYPHLGIRSFGLGLFPKPAVRGVDTTYRAFNRVREGQLVLSQVKGWEGAVAVCPGELAGYFASPEYRTFSVIADQCVLDYLSAIVSTAWFHEFLAEATRGQGARRGRTRPELFLKIRIPMPSIDNQRRGTRVFRQFGMIAPDLKRCEAELETMMPAILDRAFKGEL